jgi:hypothetical protein
MWIFTIYGFYSVACVKGADGRPVQDTVMVRARKKKHLQNLKDKFAAIEGEIITSNHADYRYRVVMPKDVWVSILSELAAEQRWSNFKNEVADNWALCGSDYHETLHEVWEAGRKLQGQPL